MCVWGGHEVQVEVCGRRKWEWEGREEVEGGEVIRFAGGEGQFRLLVPRIVYRRLSRRNQQTAGRRLLDSRCLIATISREPAAACLIADA